MVKNSDEPGPVYQSRYPVSTAHASRGVFGAGSQSPHALNKTPSHNGQNVYTSGGTQPKSRLYDDATAFDPPQPLGFPEKAVEKPPAPASLPAEDIHGETSAPIGTPPAKKPNIFFRFYRDCKAILFASWINTLLVFVPVAIACEIAHVSPTIIFAMNAVAIIPLAGLLSYATESVASELGDTIGALMNVTFGNAVELIIL